jgi:hypothetical protein
MQADLETRRQQERLELVAVGRATLIAGCAVRRLLLLLPARSRTCSKPTVARATSSHTALL